MPFETVRYRPTMSRVLVVLTVLVCVVGVVSMTVSAPLDALRHGWLLALVAVATWALFWRPELTVANDGITVVNVTRTEFVPWETIVAIDTRWALTLRTRDRVVRVWASPSPGRGRASGVPRRGVPGAGGLAGMPPEGAANAGPASAESLAGIIRSRWEAARTAEDTAAAPARTQWHVATISALALLTAASVLGLTI